MGGGARHLLATGVGELQVAGPVVSIKMDSILSCAVVPLALLGVIAATIRVYFGRCFPGLMMLGSKGEPLIDPMPELDVSISELLATTDVVVFSKNTCPNCVKAVSALRDAGIKPRIVTQLPTMKEELNELTGGHGFVPRSLSTALLSAAATMVAWAGAFRS